MKTKFTKKSLLIASVLTLFGASTFASIISRESKESNEVNFIENNSKSIEEVREGTSIKIVELQKNEDYTKMSVTNNTAETVDIYVVFAASNSANLCCPNPATPSDFSFLDSIPNNPLMATFKLAPNATQQFDSKGKCFSGNFGFYIEPQCEVKGASFKNGKSGTSIGEFTLNPGTCDEAFDISLVNGINCYLKIDVDSGLGWKYGPNKTAVTSIANYAMNYNSGNPGVYPVNCTDCIQLVNQKPCPNLPLGKPQTERICNIQRSQRGSTVRLSLVNPPK
jgi:hypothetical protein